MRTRNLGRSARTGWEWLAIPELKQNISYFTSAVGLHRPGRFRTTVRIRRVSVDFGRMRLRV